MTRNVLVVAAHPDDEALGCGGTIARHVNEGDTVHVVFLTDGVGAREPDAENVTEAAKRQAASRTAISILGVDAVSFGRFPDNQMDTVGLLDIVRYVEEAAEAFGPDVVYTHHSGDLNIDHRICNQAVLTAFRPIPGHQTTGIFAFEVCSSTEWAFGQEPSFAPNHFVDITAQLDIKRKALEAYSLEMRPWPHARSPEAVAALARVRGASVGVEAAEAFSVIREVR